MINIFYLFIESMMFFIHITMTFLVGTEKSQSTEIMLTNWLIAEIVLLFSIYTVLGIFLLAKFVFSYYKNYKNRKLNKLLRVFTTDAKTGE